MAIARLGNLEMYYEIHGKGAPLVFIAGYSCDHYFWYGMLPALAEKFQVIVCDNRGVGLSKDDGKPFTVDTMAADTVALIKHLQLSQPTVIGQSMGGAVVQTMLAKFPEVGGRWVMLNTTHVFNAVTVKALQGFVKFRQAGVDFDLLLELSLPWIASSQWLEREENTASYKAALKNHPAPQSVADQDRQIKAIAQFNAKTLNKPQHTGATLVIAAEEDLLTPAREGKQLADQLHATFVQIPGGHISPIEQPQKISQALIGFLNA